MKGFSGARENRPCGGSTEGGLPRRQTPVPGGVNLPATRQPASVIARGELIRSATSVHCPLSSRRKDPRFPTAVSEGSPLGDLVDSW